MFGHMKAEPILTRHGHSLEEALARLIEATEGAQVVRWVEFPDGNPAVLNRRRGDSQSGAFYVLDRKVGTLVLGRLRGRPIRWVQRGDFDLLVHEYDFLSLVERPGSILGQLRLAIGTAQTGRDGRPSLANERLATAV